MNPVRRFVNKPALCLAACLAAPGLSASPEWVPVAELLLGSMVARSGTKEVRRLILWYARHLKEFQTND